MAKKKSKKDNYLYIAIGLIFVSVILFATIICLSSGCVFNDNETSQQSSDFSIGIVESSEIKVLDGWQTENGKTVYYDNGVLLKGATKIGESIFVFDEDGGLMKDIGFVSIGNDVYYLDGQGKAQVGWIELDGKKYYLQENGVMAVGETEIDGKRHFFSKKGVEFIVANPWNSVSDEADLTTLPSSYGNAERAKVDKACYDDLIKMMDDCYKETRQNVYVVSGHRTFEYQKRNYRNEVKSYLSQGYSQSDAEKLAAEWVAVPGTSEHHLGLAVDIIDTESWTLDERQEHLEGQKWLMENSWKYGFILRYPKDGKEETGINYEPWHYRYLGVEIATEVHESGLTLEGYIKSLG